MKGNGYTNHCPKCLWSKHVDINPGDRGANEQALQDDARIFSVYATSKGVKLWVITEADRASTCILLPDEY